MLLAALLALVTLAAAQPPPPPPAAAAASPSLSPSPSPEPVVGGPRPVGVGVPGTAAGEATAAILGKWWAPLLAQFVLPGFCQPLHLTRPAAAAQIAT